MTGRQLPWITHLRENASQQGMLVLMPFRNSEFDQLEDSSPIARPEAVAHYVGIATPAVKSKKG